MAVKQGDREGGRLAADAATACSSLCDGAAEASPPSGFRPTGAWQPGITAPTDGTLILGYWKPAIEGGSAAFAVTGFVDGEWRDDEEQNVWAAPSHWQPLPEPPESGQ